MEHRLLHRITDMQISQDVGPSSALEEFLFQPEACVEDLRKEEFTLSKKLKMLRAEQQVIPMERTEESLRERREVERECADVTDRILALRKRQKIFHVLHRYLQKKTIFRL